MSLILKQGTRPEGLLVSISPNGKVVEVGDYEISLEDFLETTFYVLTSYDIMPNDPRLKFVKKIRSMILVDSRRPGEKCLAPLSPDALI